jgi:hypothetical protein
MCCGKDRIDIPKNQADANGERRITPGNRRLYLVKTSAKTPLQPGRSGLRVRGHITARVSAQRGGLHLV